MRVLWGEGFGGVMWLGCRREEGLKATEPRRGAGRGEGLRPSHKFSDFSGTFSLGVTFHWYVQFLDKFDNFTKVGYTSYMIRADLLSRPIKKVKIVVPLSEYWKLLGIPFIRERFMKSFGIYVETVVELIEVSECANFGLRVLRHFLGEFQSGAVFVYITPEEEPILYK